MAGVGYRRVVGGSAGNLAGLRERAATLPPKGKTPEISQAKEPQAGKTLWKVGAGIPAPKV
jgi:hypothetical protein